MNVTCNWKKNEIQFFGNATVFLSYALCKPNWDFDRSKHVAFYCGYKISCADRCCNSVYVFTYTVQHALMKSHNAETCI
jgi:hypothetical protein